MVTLEDAFVKGKNRLRSISRSFPHSFSRSFLAAVQSSGCMGGKSIWAWFSTGCGPMTSRLSHSLTNAVMPCNIIPFLKDIFLIRLLEPTIVMDHFCHGISAPLQLHIIV